MTSLLLVAHGDPGDPRSSGPARAAAEQLDATGRFACVRVAALKESPPPGEVLRALPPERIVVPFFMAQGYFVTEVLPRVLAAAGVPYRATAAVGTSGRITASVLDVASAVPHVRSQTALVVLAHGTARNTASRDTAFAAARALGACGYAEVATFFTDDTPSLEELDRCTAAPTVLAVPFFAGAGFHPSALPRAAQLKPTRSLLFAEPVATSPRIVDAVLDVIDASRAG